VLGLEEGYELGVAESLMLGLPLGSPDGSELGREEEESFKLGLLD
jgi:hypothetical protein